MTSNKNDLIRALEHLLSGDANQREVQRVKEAAGAGKVSVASGTRSVGVAGGVSDSLIVTGGNVSINLALATPDLSRPEWRIIEAVIGLQNPKHFCLRQTMASVYNSANSEERQFLPAYVKIVIDTEGRDAKHYSSNFYWAEVAGEDETGTCLVVYMNPVAYTSTQGILDDLYFRYLVGKYRPYTYGKDWVLKSFGTGLSRVAVPWVWLVDRSSHSQEIEEDSWRDSARLVNTPLSEVDPKIRNSSPQSLGLSPNTYWYIARPTSISAVGFATSVKALSDMIRHCDPEIMKRLLLAYSESDEGYEHVVRDWATLKRVSPAQVDTEHYRYSFVFEDPWWWLRNNGIALVAASEWSRA